MQNWQPKDKQLRDWREKGFFIARDVVPEKRRV